jgi:hypothetical protein
MRGLIRDENRAEIGPVKSAYERRFVAMRAEVLAGLPMGLSTRGLRGFAVFFSFLKNGAGFGGLKAPAFTPVSLRFTGLRTG